MATRNSNHLPSFIWIVYLVLFSLSIPWWVPEQLSMKLIGGLPLWLICTLSFILVIVAFTIYVIQRWWPESSHDL